MNNLTQKINIKFNSLKNYDSRKIGSNVRFIHKYLRILLMYLLPYIPIVFSHIILFVFSSVDSDTKTITFQAVAFIQTLLFSIISYGIFFICQIVTRLQQELDLTHRKQQPKQVVDTGITILGTVTLLSVIVFSVTSIIFVELKTSNNNENLRWSVYNYTFILIPYLFCLIIGHYFMHISFVSGFNWIKVSIGCIASMFVEIILMYVFLYHIKTLDPLFAIAIPMLIVSFLRGITFILVYLFKINYFNYNKQNSKIFIFNKDLYKGLLKASALSSVFMISFMISNVIQTIFIILSKKISIVDSNYLWTDNYSLLLMAKIIVYNFLYLFFCTSKSFGLTVIEHEETNSLNYIDKIARSRKLTYYNLLINFFNWVLSFIILLIMKPIIENLYSGFYWINNPVIDLPSSINNVNNILELMIRISQNAMLVGAFAYFVFETSINMRIITFKFFKRNYIMFIAIIIGYILSFTLLSFVFVFLTNNIFFGLSGYLFPMILYGIYCYFITYSFNAYRQYEIYKNNFPVEMNNISKTKFIFVKWLIDFKLVNNKNN